MPPDDDHYDEPVAPLKVTQHYPGLEQLVCYALANQDFSQRLIVEPIATVAQTDAVQLSPDELQILACVDAAADIHDFAARLYAQAQQRIAA